MLPDGFRWDENHYVPGALWLVRVRWVLVIGSVCPRIDDGWVSRIERYRWRDRAAIAPTREIAMRWVEQWVRTRAH